VAKSPATSAVWHRAGRQGRSYRRGAAADAQNGRQSWWLADEAFDQICAGVLADRSQFFKDLSAPFYGANRPGAKVSQGLRDSFWLRGMMRGFKGAYDCIKAFSETDFTEDLKKFDVPTVVLHGDDDQIVPIGDSAMLSSNLIKGATLKIIEGASHGMCSTDKEQINAESPVVYQGLVKCGGHEHMSTRN
jgi:pimeloyl-ACP methyl ester carboxylesterase